MLSVTEHKNIEFSSELVAQFDDIVTRYPEGKQKAGIAADTSSCSGRIWLGEPGSYG